MIRLGTDLRFVDKTANWDKVSRGVAASTRANMANTDRTHRGGLTFSNTVMVCKQRGREEGVYLLRLSPSVSHPKKIAKGRKGKDVQICRMSDDDGICTSPIISVFS